MALPIRSAAAAQSVHLTEPWGSFLRSAANTCGKRLQRLTMFSHASMIFSSGYSALYQDSVMPSLALMRCRSGMTRMFLLPHSSRKWSIIWPAVAFANRGFSEVFMLEHILVSNPNANSTEKGRRIALKSFFCSMSNTDAMDTLQSPCKAFSGFSSPNQFAPLILTRLPSRRIAELAAEKFMVLYLI